jgi:hypothetical protein
MITLIEYQCEICNRKYLDAQSALECEAKGLANTETYPIGLMYEHHHNGYVGMFCIAEVTPSEYNKHYVNISSWACRMPGFPPFSLGKEKCGGSLDYIGTSSEAFAQFISYHKVTKDKIGTKEYNLMVDYLRKAGITPQYYNESKELITL